MGFLSKRLRKSAISKHCQSTYHDTLKESQGLVLVWELDLLIFIVRETAS